MRASKAANGLLLAGIAVSAIVWIGLVALLAGSSLGDAAITLGAIGMASVAGAAWMMNGRRLVAWIVLLAPLLLVMAATLLLMFDPEGFRM